MVPMNKSPIAIGSNLGRSRWQRAGWRRPERRPRSGKALTTSYVLQLDGTKKRGHRSVILGLKSKCGNRKPRRSCRRSSIERRIRRTAGLSFPRTHASLVLGRALQAFEGAAMEDLVAAENDPVFQPVYFAGVRGRTAGSDPPIRTADAPERNGEEVLLQRRFEV